MSNKEGIDARTRGAVLDITVSVPKKGTLTRRVTHIWAMFGGMGGKESDDDIVGG